MTGAGVYPRATVGSATIIVFVVILKVNGPIKVFKGSLFAMGPYVLIRSVFQKL